MSELLNIHENLHDKGYAPIEIDIGKSDMQTAINRYLGFLSVDNEYHEATKFFVSNRGDGDYGQFTRLSGSEGVRGVVPDNKDIFHFGSMSRQIIEARMNGNIPREMKQFLDATEEIFWAGQRSKRKVLEQLDYENTGLVSILQTERHTLNDVLRFIAYYPNAEKLAKGHFDRSTCTLAIGESHEGLRMTTGQNGVVLDADETYLADLESRLRPVDHVSGEAKFFLGAGWNRLPIDYKIGVNDLDLGWHDVISSEKQVDEKVMRWAIVMFINPYAEMEGYTVPTPAETRPYKQLGRLAI